MNQRACYFRASTCLALACVLVLSASVSVFGANSANLVPKSRSVSTLAPDLQEDILPSDLPEVKATAFVLLDSNKGLRLAANHANQIMAPVALTKLMTAYVVFDSITQNKFKLEDFTSPSLLSTQVAGARSYLEVNKPVTISDLLKGMLVQSANDATLALVERVAGTESNFVALMNEHAAKLGMKQTHFLNATGLPQEGQMTTANDLALLATALIKNYPNFLPLFSVKSFQYNNITQVNQNLLLFRDPFVDGLKTAYLPQDGYHIIATSNRGGQRILLVLMGARNEELRALGASKLLNYALQLHDTPKLYATGEVLKSVPVYNSYQKMLEVAVDKDIFVTVPQGSVDHIKQTMVYQSPLIAPLKAGQTVGELVIHYDGKILLKTPLVAKQDVTEWLF
ncbi:MAG: D-alanyl-D-alanine carboxypeptidase, partial [Neisseriaceae bacterium]|nr:D-alanyl-D-alanine carboxypeptidase [Neisseriaceae bacterium]